MPLNEEMVRRLVFDRGKNVLPSASNSGFGNGDDVLVWPLEKWDDVVSLEAEVEVVLAFFAGRELEAAAV